MTYTVRFQGATRLRSAGAQDDLRIWSYAVDGPFAAGESLALGIPVSLIVHNPSQFPDDQGLGEVYQHDGSSSRRYVVAHTSGPGTQTVSFVASAEGATAELLLFVMPTGHDWESASFTTDRHDTPAIGQLLPAPAPVHAGNTPLPQPDGAGNGSSGTFTGTLPYASELFGVYQPLASVPAATTGRPSTVRLARVMALLPQEVPPFGPIVPTPAPDPASPGVLAPVGLVDLFREYFFELDTFLGPPVGHIWISPGGTVEVVETSTRRTLVEKATEQSEEIHRQSEDTVTQQDDIADAVKDDNSNDTKLGVSLNQGAKIAVYHADASASFSAGSTLRHSQEETHKHARTQSTKVSSEIRRNFKTSFKTTTEVTDTTSRRYVVQNTTDRLVNYELRRKMRKVGVRLQHIGSRLCWEVFLDQPGRDLGLGDLVHLVEAPDLSSLHRPDPPPPLEAKTSTYTCTFSIITHAEDHHAPHQDRDYRLVDAIDPTKVLDPTKGPQDLGNLVDPSGNDTIANSSGPWSPPPPAPGYTIRDKGIDLLSAKANGSDARFVATFPKLTATSFRVFASWVNFGGAGVIELTLTIQWDPPAINPAQQQYDKDMVEYNHEVEVLQRAAFANAVRERLEVVSSLRARPAEDLRDEERQLVYGSLLDRLEIVQDEHLGSELIRQMFDVDEMLYFVAPNYWRPSTAVGDNANDAPHPSNTSTGRYPVPDNPLLPAPSPTQAHPDPLAGRTVTGWYSHRESNNAIDRTGHLLHVEQRIDYLVTENTQPAPRGSSLGWLIQIDGDERRNEFLNAAWVKAVFPIRPGHEPDALTWLRRAPKVDRRDAFDAPYHPQDGDPPTFASKKVGEVLDMVAAQLHDANQEFGNTLATEKVYQTGFDPLENGFEVKGPFETFDGWIEVLPTDQVVAVEVSYDPRTGVEL